jgi:1-acyl-sn-glycerol-3-phosphate acyltransferase
LARESLFRNRFFGFFIRSINAHPVHADGADFGIFKTIFELLSQGKKVVIFPEGTRSNGELGPIKPGIGLLLSRSKTAIIPAYIHGAHQIWVRTQRFPKPWGKLICVFGSPILWSSLSHLDKDEAQAVAIKRLEESILALKKWVEEGMKGTPP